MPPGHALRLSAIIICHDEADRIDACLASLKDCVDEIVCVDSGSTDNTLDICRRYTSRIHSYDWPGYGPQKQRALELATGEWVLSIDADERVTSEFAAFLNALRSGGIDMTNKVDLFAIRSTAFFLGKKLRFGRHRKHAWRLFRRDGSSFTNSPVHEHVVTSSGRTATLDIGITHDTFRNFRHAMDKQMHYAWLWAEERHKRGKKVTLLRAISSGLWAFLADFVFRLGVLDGRMGLLTASQSAIYTFCKYASLWTLNQESRNSGSIKASK